MIMLWSFLGDENALKLIGVMVSQLCEQLETIMLYILSGWNLWNVNYISIIFFVLKNNKLKYVITLHPPKNYLNI